jgi:fumarate hydratase class I
MQDLTPHILELIRLTSTSLPADVERTLVSAQEKEEDGSAAQNIMRSILENITIARETSTPICQDTGTPIFFVRYPESCSTKKLIIIIRSAVAEATESLYLRPNAVNSLTGKNNGNNLGDKYFPVIHLQEIDGETLIINLLLKGGGCENVGRQYSLPDSHLNAGRDLEGVRKVALDAVFQAQGQGCAPGFLGIAIGGDRGTSYLASKEVFLEDLSSHHPDPVVAALEKRITKEANELRIGPMGLGGRSTILGTRIIGLHRLPASYFVSISYMCWAFRRHRISITGEKVEFN